VPDWGIVVIILYMAAINRTLAANNPQ
jgi:hypothetical protein